MSELAVLNHMPWWVVPLVLGALAGGWLAAELVMRGWDRKP